MPEFIRRTFVRLAQREGQYACHTGNETIWKVVEHLMEAYLNVIQEILAGPFKQWQFIIG